MIWFSSVRILTCSPRRSFPSITASALSRRTSPRTSLEVFFLSLYESFSSSRPRLVVESFGGFLVPPAIYSVMDHDHDSFSELPLPRQGRQVAQSFCRCT